MQPIRIENPVISDIAADITLAEWSKLIRQILAPPQNMTVVEWADTYRRLPRETSAIPGRWRTHNFEIARGPMMACTEPGVRILTAMVSTQTLKTELILNLIGHHMMLDPCPMLIALPKDDVVSQFSKERLTPMIMNSPALRELMNLKRQKADGSREKKNETLDFKDFPGGFLAMVSAGSPTNLAMRPIRITFADELDKFAPSKEEGDPLAILERRTETFGDRAFHVRCCSPTLKGYSRIERSYEESDQRKPFVACPKCGKWQHLEFFKHVHWDKSDEGVHYPATAAIFCEFCEYEWSETERLQAISTAFKIRWRQTRKFTCCGVEQDPMKTRRWSVWSEKTQVSYELCEICNRRAVSNRHAGFNASKLYSPIVTVKGLAMQWIAEKDNLDTKQVFYNTALGLPFGHQLKKQADPLNLIGRCEDFPAKLPRAVNVLTAGLDVQAGSDQRMGRIECELVGWGLGEESWSWDHKVFVGDPAQDEVWKQVDEYLLQRFEHEAGGLMKISAACVDSGGHNTEEVYKFCRARLARNIWAIKGSNQDRGTQWQPTWIIPPAKKSRETGFKPQSIGVNSAKDHIRNLFLIDEPGLGYAHFPKGRPDEYFKQLTAESIIEERKNGIAVRRWVLPHGRANEALDCRVYAYAALQGLIATRNFKMERAAALIGQGVPTEAKEAETPAKPETTDSPRVRRSKWLG